MRKSINSPLEKGRKIVLILIGTAPTHRNTYILGFPPGHICFWESWVPTNMAEMTALIGKSIRLCLLYSDTSHYSVFWESCVIKQLNRLIFWVCGVTECYRSVGIRAHLYQDNSILCFLFQPRKQLCRSPYETLPTWWMPVKSQPSVTVIHLPSMTHFSMWYIPIALLTGILYGLYIKGTMAVSPITYDPDDNRRGSDIS